MGRYLVAMRAEGVREQWGIGVKGFRARMAHEGQTDSRAESPKSTMNATLQPRLGVYP